MGTPAKQPTAESKANEDGEQQRRVDVATRTKRGAARISINFHFFLKIFIFFLKFL